MRKVVIGILVLTLSFPIAIFASENLCTYLPGTWMGTYTFLHHRDCHDNRGYTHMMSAEVKRLSTDGIQYQADLTLQMGQRVIVNFVCQNSAITISDYPDSVSQLSCANGACFVKYQDSKLSSTTIHVITQYANDRN